MAQYARPSQDVAVGTWTTQAGAATNLWQAIDEDAADEADFAQSTATAPTTDVYEFRLSAAPAPFIDRGHVLRYRCRKSQALGNIRGLTVELRQGGTVVASNSHPDLTGLWQPDNAFLLTPAQAGTITDYADLLVRLIPTGNTGGTASARRRVQVAWARLRVPDSTWGAVANSEGPTRWSYTLDGVTGEGSSREDALVDLFGKLRDADPQSALRQRQWTMAYYGGWKLRRYPLDVLPGVTAETQADYDRKMANFDSLTAAADAEDGG